VSGKIDANIIIQTLGNAFLYARHLSAQLDMTYKCAKCPLKCATHKYTTIRNCKRRATN
jgi:hypothetical protein